MSTKYQSPLDVIIEVYTRKWNSNRNSVSASLYSEVIELARNLKAQELHIVNVAYTEGFKEAMDEAKKTLQSMVSTPSNEL